MLSGGRRLPPRRPWERPRHFYRTQGGSNMGGNEVEGFQPPYGQDQAYYPEGHNGMYYGRREDPRMDDDHEQKSYAYEQWQQDQAQRPPPDQYGYANTRSFMNERTTGPPPSPFGQQQEYGLQDEVFEHYPTQKGYQRRQDGRPNREGFWRANGRSGPLGRPGGRNGRQPPIRHNSGISESSSSNEVPGPRRR